MPAIAHEHVQGGSDVTTQSDTFVDAGCTSTALAAGDWLVIGLCNHRNENNTCGSEVEGRYGTTRLAVSSFFSLFGQFNSGDSAAGGLLQFATIITANGTDTLNMRVRRIDASGADEVRAGGQSWIAISLDGLTEGVDYWVAEGPNSDTAEVSPTDGTWVEGDADGQLIFTPTESGDYLFIASAEQFESGTPGTDEQARARFRFQGAAAGTEIQGFVDVAEGTSARWGVNFMEADVQALTATTEYTALWEFANQDGASTHYRRSRVFALRLDAFTGYEFIVDGGGISTDANEEAVSGVTYDFDGTPALVLAVCSHQNGGNWGAGFLHRDSDDDDFPPAGRMWAYGAGGLDAASEIAQLFFGVIDESGDPDTYRILGQSDGTFELTYGRNAGNTTDQRTPVIAIALATPSTDIVLTPSAGSLRFSSVAALFNAGAATLSPSAGSLRLVGGDETVSPGPVTVQPAAGSLRIVSQAPVLAPGQVALSPSASSLRLASQAPSSAWTAVLTPAASSMRFVGAAPVVAPGSVTLQPTAGSMRFRSNTVVGDSVALLGHLSVAVKVDRTTYVIAVRIDD